MKRTITSEVVVAHSLCPRKAFLLLGAKERGKPHEYAEILEEQRNQNRDGYLQGLREQHAAVPFAEGMMRTGSELLTQAVLTHRDLQAYCDVLTKVKTTSSLGRFSYEPTVIIGTRKVTKADRSELAFAGHVLGKVQGRLPDFGRIVGKEGNVHRLRLDGNYKDQARAVRALKAQVTTSTSEPPPAILNSHCSLCQYMTQCTRAAQQADDLSLLDRMTPKLLQKYHKKGIFTVHQLSFLFRPRRRRKHPENIPVSFSVELQALAIRTGTTYIQQLPQVTREAVELYLDIEGTSDSDTYYLIVFRLTETREAAVVHEFLSHYQGILISDFYAGYDAALCRQQKCWVHLIRDLNDDLWKAPFDSELEAFIAEVRELVVPILSAADKYGLKKRHFNKFQTAVDCFYSKHIQETEYQSELAVKYQKRFLRYRQSLFTFLEHDGIPWNNNMAERAIRHLAVQRKISGSFFLSFIPSYLTLLAIAQTCRFQGKSFLRFLLSQQQDVDNFKEKGAG